MDYRFLSIVARCFRISSFSLAAGLLSRAIAGAPRNPGRPMPDAGSEVA